jgi:Domain of unknown function (DUF6485)
VEEIVMDCPNADKNLSVCRCTYEPCRRKGRCCECIQYHIAMKELPACAFPPEAERTYDRSFSKFIEVNR